MLFESAGIQVVLMAGKELLIKIVRRCIRHLDLQRGVKDKRGLCGGIEEVEGEVGGVEECCGVVVEGRETIADEFVPQLCLIEDT